MTTLTTILCHLKDIVPKHGPILQPLTTLRKYNVGTLVPLDTILELLLLTENCPRHSSCNTHPCHDTLMIHGVTYLGTMAQGW